MHFKISSAICFNLYQSKILSSGNGLIHQGVICQVNMIMEDREIKMETCCEGSEGGGNLANVCMSLLASLASWFVSCVSQ